MPVTRVEIEARAPLAAGRSFGASGPYEYLTGVLHFASDPRHAGNEAICDLGLAPTNGQGLVEHRAQFHLLKPVGPKPRGRVLVDSINRGNMTAVATFNSVARRTDGNPDVDSGNGFLFRHGYSVLSIGVQWDPPESPERMRAWYPEGSKTGGACAARTSCSGGRTGARRISSFRMQVTSPTPRPTSTTRMQCSRYATTRTTSRPS